MFLSVELTAPSASGPGSIKRLQTLDMTSNQVQTYPGSSLPDLRGKTVIVYDAVAALAALHSAGVKVNDFEDVKLMVNLTDGFEPELRLFTPVEQHYFQYSTKQVRNPMSGINLFELRRLYQQLSGCQQTRCYQREKAAIPIIADMQRAGIAFDYQDWHQALEPKRNELAQLKCDLHLHLNNRIEKIQQEQQLSQYLRRYDDAIKAALYQGRMYCQWDSFASLSGRMASRRPNLQSMPKLSRPYFKAKSGHCLVFADYSQIELRVLAELTKDENLLELFQHNGDLHCQTAASLFNKDITGISTQERSIAKAINFGIAYGITAHGIQKNLIKQQISLTLEEAEQLRLSFLDLYPGIRRYQQIIVQAKRVKSLGGRYFDTKGLTNAQRMNLPVQATAAEGLKEALGLLYQRSSDTWKLVATLHDELLMEVPETDTQEAELLLKDVMVTGMKTLLKNVPVVCNISCGPTWG